MQRCRSEQVDEDDVDLLTSLANSGCSAEQQAALLQVLTHETPWEVLGVSMDADSRQGTKAYRSLSLLLHPDKCRHARGQEAFRELSDALEWATDRPAWEERQETQGSE